MTDIIIPQNNFIVAWVVEGLCASVGLVPIVKDRYCGFGSLIGAAPLTITRQCMSSLRSETQFVPIETEHSSDLSLSYAYDPGPEADVIWSSSGSVDLLMAIGASLERDAESSPAIVAN